MAFVLDDSGEPINISGASEIHLLLHKQDGTVLDKIAATGFAYGLCKPIYCYGFSLSAAETALLPVNPNQTVQLKILFGTANVPLILRNCLTVTDPPF